MHVFQPIETTEFDFNIFQMVGQDWFALVTEKDGKPNAMTAGWGGVGVMWGKNVAFVVVRESRYTKEILDETEFFSMCFLNKDKYKTVMRYLGAVSGKQEDKISAMGLNVEHFRGVPYLDEARTVFCLRKMFKAPMEAANMLDPEIIPKWYEKGDYHNLYMAEIIQVMAR